MALPVSQPAENERIVWLRPSCAIEHAAKLARERQDTNAQLEIVDWAKGRDSAASLLVVRAVSGNPSECGAKECAGRKTNQNRLCSMTHTCRSRTVLRWTPGRLEFCIAVNAAIQGTQKQRERSVRCETSVSGYYHRPGFVTLSPP